MIFSRERERGREVILCIFGRRQQQQPTGAWATVAHSHVGKEVAKDLSHEAVFVGYVTEYCVSEMSGEEISPELFHIEYEDGGEEDIEAEEVNAAIALASSRRNDV